MSEASALLTCRFDYNGRLGARKTVDAALTLQDAFYRRCGSTDCYWLEGMIKMTIMMELKPKLQCGRYVDYDKHWTANANKLR